MQYKAPTFSVLVPTYNQADFLSKAFDSLLSQTDQDWEAVVVDDGSTDHTHRVIQSYASKDSRIRAFRKENGGTASALNKGLEEATGDWICWLSSDDLFDPDKLAIHRLWIGKCPETRFFFTYFKLLREASGNIEEHHDLWGPLPNRLFQTLGLMRRNFISGITICIHRDIFREVGGFDAGLRYGQDYDRWLRITSCYPAIFIPEWTVVNRNHSGQGSEVFPQACSFDSAKAAIQFLQEKTYPQLFPLLDMSRVEVSFDALAEGLEIASDPDAFFYWMGVHPGLLFCIYDWLSESTGDPEKQTLWNRIETIAVTEASRHTGVFGSMWRHALMTARLRPAQVRRGGITSAAIGRSFHKHLCVNRPDQADALVRYFQQFMKGESLDTTEPRLAGREVVLVTPFEEDPGGIEVAFQAARMLSAAGGVVTIITPGEPAVDYRDGIFIFSAPNANILEQCVRGIRPWDMCAAIDKSPLLPATLVLPLPRPGSQACKKTAVDVLADAFGAQAGDLVSPFVQKAELPNIAQQPPSFLRRALRKSRRTARAAWEYDFAGKFGRLVKKLQSRTSIFWESYTRKNAARIGAWAVSRYCPGNGAFDEFKRRGFYLLRDHFYLPLPDFQDLSDSFLENESQMIGIDLDEFKMLNLIEKTLSPYNEEFRAFPIDRTTPEISRFYLINGGYMAVDGNMYYGFVRHLKPRKIIETGCGLSSLLCSEALHLNEHEGHSTHYTCIEPYPQPYLMNNPFLKVNRFVKLKIQHTDLKIFEELEENDILFIDTTHALRMGGDVQFIYCEILPRLKQGVYVHIHDISLPRQYPRIYHEEYRYFWNEQYLLQAYLAHNSRTEVVWAGNWLRLRDQQRFNRIFPEFQIMRQHYPQSEPSALWLRTK